MHWSCRAANGTVEAGDALKPRMISRLTPSSVAARSLSPLAVVVQASAGMNNQKRL